MSDTSASELTTGEPVHLLADGRRPPAGAPNVLVIVLDDTGFAQLGSFGSDIATPNMDRLAAGGLRYNRFHVTSLCSPTRASFMTGRNHHAVGMGLLADIPLSYPGYTAEIPKSAATLPKIMKDQGYSTTAVGKWHLTPRWQRSAAGPFDTWPLGLGFERYYGFLQGDTNHWSPNLVQDNHYVEPPAKPEYGYHLSEDLADRAIGYLLDQRHSAPGKPFFLYLAMGAMHAPHHVAPEWVEPYRGRFDKGWDQWRDEIFARQLSQRIVPEGTVLTPRPTWLRSWDALSGDEQRMHARQQEVFAGFMTHADAQIGRVLDHLELSSELENTLVLLFSDNGASAEGGQQGSVNEHRFGARMEESLAENLEHYDDWGGFDTYNHYSWAWAWAGNTPMRLWKRYTWLGGTRTPLIVRWPKGIAAPGGIRSQFVHAVDLAPTILDAAGLEVPSIVDGVVQQRIDGASFLKSFQDPEAPDARATQYFEMLGSRSIYHEGWKATTNHISKGVPDEEALAEGSREFHEDVWELIKLDEDFSESTDLAAEHPERLEALQELWLSEARQNQVLPIADGFMSRIDALIHPTWPAGQRLELLPGGSPIVDEALPMLVGGFLLSAEVELASSEQDGVLAALGDFNGGFALFISEGRLIFSLSRAGILTELVGDRPVPSGPARLCVAYLRDAGDEGRFALLHDDDVVGELPFTGHFPFAFQHGGAALRLGADTGFPVSRRYQPPAAFGGILHRVVVETPAPGAWDPLEQIRAALHSD
jgi:arylsulfatase